MWETVAGYPPRFLRLCHRRVLDGAALHSLTSLIKPSSTNPPRACKSRLDVCLNVVTRRATATERIRSHDWCVQLKSKATQEEDPLAAILLPRKFQNKRDNREVMRKINADEGERWTQGGPCYGRDVVKRTAQTLRAKLLS